jgi:hypothetical protein
MSLKQLPQENYPLKVANGNGILQWTCLSVIGYLSSVRTHLVL